MRYMYAAGIRSPLKTTHSLRHSAATTALANGATVTKVQSMLRHSDPKTTLAYVRELDWVETPLCDLSITKAMCSQRTGPNGYLLRTESERSRSNSR